VYDVQQAWAPNVLGQKKGVVRFQGYADYAEVLENMTKAESSSVFAETWNAILGASLANSEALGAVLEKPEYAPDPASFPSVLDEDDSLTPQLEFVSRVIKARGDPDLGTERDVFFVELGGFDTHTSNHDVVTSKFAVINTALESFRAEMRAQGVWDSVAVLSASDFGRTLRSNGAGTDHAWGGHHFLVGGGVKGGRMHGAYPSRLDDDGPDVIRSGGRFLPTTSWEGVWHGLATWFGVEDELLPMVLPNMPNFKPV